MPYRDFFMSLAYITGGQYVPMVNSKLLAKVIIGGVREEISIDRLMQDAQQDIAHEMRKAEAEGADEKEKAKRIAQLFASKNMHVQQMANFAGAHSTLAKESYSKCINMSQMQQQFQAQQPSSSMHFTPGPLPSLIRPTIPQSHLTKAPPPPYLQPPPRGPIYTQVQQASLPSFARQTPPGPFYQPAPPPPFVQQPLPGDFYREAQQAAPPTYSGSSAYVNTDEMNYDLLANQEVSEEQAARIVQKWQNRK